MLPITRLETLALTVAGGALAVKLLLVVGVLGPASTAGLLLGVLVAGGSYAWRHRAA